VRSLIALGLSMMLLAAPAGAQQGGDRAAAQALFEEAVRLRESGRVPEACGKFEESLRLDPTAGTRFNLADCDERIGKTASAWSLFLEVAAEMEQKGDSARAEAANRRAQHVEPRLARLVITATEPVPGLTLKRDGVEVGQPQWGTPVPVDLGSHRVEATAPGKAPWSTTVEVRQEGKVVRFEVPALEDAPEPEPGAVMPGMPPPYGQSPPDQGGVAPMAVAGITIAAVGVVGLAIGTAFGVIAMGKKSDAEELCPSYPDSCPTQEGIDANDEAKTAGTVSTIGFVAGGVLLVGGVVLWIAAPSGDGGVALELAPTSAGVRARF
jgi:hypothetical protein